MATGWTVTEKAVGSDLKASSLSNWDVGNGMDESARPNTNKVAIHCSGKYLAHVQGGLLKKEMFEDGPEKGIGEAGCRTVVVSDWNHKVTQKYIFLNFTHLCLVVCTSSRKEVLAGSSKTNLKSLHNLFELLTEP